MQPATSSAQHSAPASTLEFLCICCALFCLPLFEAPKNVVAVALVLLLAVGAVSRRAARIGLSEVVIIGLAVILWVSPLLANYEGFVSPLNSAPRWTLLALFVVAAGSLDYSRPQVIAIWASLLVGGIFAVVDSFWVWSFSGRDYPEFRSVGHVNHSSMYSLVVLAAGLGALFTDVRWLRWLGAVAILSVLAYLPASRSIVGAVSIFVIVGVGAWLALAARGRLSPLRVFAVAALGLGVVGLVLLTPPAAGFREEIVLRVTGDNLLSGRDRILNSALAVWDRHPLIGTGWFSFGPVTSEEAVRAALATQGRDYDPDVYWHHSHGHNLWVTMLIERGLVGVGLVTFLIFLYFRALVPLALRRRELDPVGHGAAVGALLVAVGFVVAGLGNTTMMNEHGQAGMAFIAVALAYLRGQGVCAGRSPGSR